LKYEGLYTYCVKELRFTETQAYQRCQAMRAMKDLPELKPMIESGSLSVSSVSMVHTHLNQEMKSGVRQGPAGKLELFQKMQNCTSKEVLGKLAEIRGEVRTEKLILELDEELQALWTKVKGLAAHRSGGDSAEVLRILAKEWLAKNDPARENSRTSRRTVSLSEKFTVKAAVDDETVQVKTNNSIQSPSISPTLTPVAPTSTPSFRRNARYIPAKLRRETWKRDDAKCTRCGSIYALEIDHIEPFALGGKNEFENLRLLCRSCNQFQAIGAFGVNKMEGHRRK
jgi:5-methylcytosine-specific restriction endonuclease McrA